MKKISFGTDGWRGILARDFTFANVELVARAVADYLRAHGMARRGLVVGYDNRFLSEQFAAAVAGVMAGRGIPVYLTRRATPTPVVAFAVRHYRAAGAVMLTASHNPPEYNGFKFIPDYAGPALPHITGEIEERIRALQAAGPDSGRPGAGEPAGGEAAAPVEEIDPFEDYVRHIAGLVDLAAIGRAGLAVAVDPMYGAGVGYLDEILRRAGARVRAIRNHRDPLFGGGLPEPTARTLGELREMVVRGGAVLGLALDGDADRFGIIDKNGEFIAPNQFLPLLYHHLLTLRGLKGPAARTVATTHLLDRMAEKNGQEVMETPVGFKYIGQCLHEKGAILGGEESGGLSIAGHVPEKDGILAGLLAAEMVAARGKGLTELLEEIYAEYGRVVSERLDIHTTEQEKERVLATLHTVRPESLAGRKVTGLVTVDGLKILLEDGSWTLIRPSGTEPLFRIYVEAAAPEAMREIQNAVRKILE
ncbi:MAG: phosphoglucomutase/phosphomannomutase family protein [Firmicutes bacterium]|nr:phosphoglucomutase/phosphomannomutase family protein [Bacillota bacterium]